MSHGQSLWHRLSRMLRGRKPPALLDISLVSVSQDLEAQVPPNASLRMADPRWDVEISVRAALCFQASPVCLWVCSLGMQTVEMKCHCWLSVTRIIYFIELGTLRQRPFAVSGKIAF